MERRPAARLPMALFVMEVKTGSIKTILKSTDWLNHLLFSPTDPSLLMYCHEGPWHKVDRIWTIRTDGSENRLIHKRTIAKIAGHEFWSKDGQAIWYDLQTPRGEDFWVAGYAVATGERTWYHLERNEWSIHFNVTRDGKLFLRRWRRSRSGGACAGRPMDLFVPGRTDSQRRDRKVKS